MSEEIDVTPEKVAAVDARMREMAARLGVAGCLVALEGADTLRALSARLAEVERDFSSALKAAEDAADLMCKMDEARKEAEAKLAKARDAFREIAGECGCSTARAIIAEIGEGYE
jgi:hypothetical protein